MRESVTTDKDLPTLSLCIVAKDEEKTLPALFASLLVQSYPANRMQILLIDSMSSDSTRRIMEGFACGHCSEYREILVLENTGVRLANGWNVALAHADCDLVMRMDAHAEMPDDYIRSCVSHIVDGEDIAGGKVLNIPGADTDEALITNMVEDSMFGGSIAAFRHADNERYVDTLAFAVYRTSIFDEVGLFDERLVRTEDNEMHYRMRTAGYRFLYDPKIVSWRRTRPTFMELVRQKYLNGYWIGRTVPLSPICFSAYHFVPAVFVCTLVGCMLLMLAKHPQPLLVLTGMYGMATLAMTAAAVASAKRRPVICLLMPALFLILHIAYGAGTLAGLARGAVTMFGSKSGDRS